MKEVGERWNREDLTVFGKALVSNTLMTVKVTYRASVNVVSNPLRKKITNTVREFMWRKRQAEGSNAK